MLYNKGYNILKGMIIMKTTILILINKLTTKICHLFKRDGSVFPGSIVNKYDKTQV